MPHEPCSLQIGTGEGSLGEVGALQIQARRDSRLTDPILMRCVRPSMQDGRRPAAHYLDVFWICHGVAGLRLCECQSYTTDFSRSHFDCLLGGSGFVADLAVDAHGVHPRQNIDGNFLAAT